MENAQFRLFDLLVFTGEEAWHALVFCAREEEIDSDDIDAAATGVSDKHFHVAALDAIADRIESASASLIGGRTTNVWCGSRSIAASQAPGSVAGPIQMSDNSFTSELLAPSMYLIPDSVTAIACEANTQPLQ